MKKELRKIIRHSVVLMVGGALLGTLLLVLAYCLPSDTVKRHVAASYDTLIRQEDSMPAQGVLRYIWEHTETFTDCIMLQYTFERIPGKNAFEHAMWAYHSDFSNDDVWNPEDSITALLFDQDTSGMYLREYSRYWHGYLSYITPLLLIFNLKTLLTLQTILVIVLMAAIFFTAFQKKKPAVAAAFLAGILFIKILSVPVSLDMAVCWLIILIAMLVLLYKGNWLEAKHYYPEFFLIIGMLTSYNDFLTYPAATLGYVLCTYFLLRDTGKFWGNAARLVGYSFMWGVGYAGMWGCKWLIADVTLRTGTIKNALWTVLGITSNISGHGLIPRLYGGMRAISLNLKEYDQIFYPVLAAALGLGIVVSLIRAICRKVPVSRIAVTVITYAVIAAIPFAWMVAAQFHSAVHARFTFRIISIAAMAGGALMMSLWQLGSAQKKIS